MAEYIEKTELIKKLCFETAEWYYSPTIKTIKDFPAADVQPVKRGKWIYYKNNGIFDIHKCTVCNTPLELPMDVVPSSVFCYCPHCGADMRNE